MVYRLIRIMDPELPEGWRRVEEESGQVYYLSRQPQVKISKRSQLEGYHKKGRYTEMSLEKLNFGKKRRVKKYSYSKSEGPGEYGSTESDDKGTKEIETDVLNDLREVKGKGSTVPAKKLLPSQDCTGNTDDIMMEVLESDGEYLPKKNILDKKTQQLNAERVRLEKAVRKLTLNDSIAINHKVSLLETAKILNDRRRSLVDIGDDDLNFVNLKSRIDATENWDELIRILNANCLIQKRLGGIAQSKMLEQLLKISSVPENPLREFPMDVNRNHYSDIVGFALAHTPDVLDLILKLSTRNEVPVSESDVVRCAYIFSTLASAVNRNNNALKKMNSVNTKTNGLTNEGLDALANVGAFETSRSFRNIRDFLASISEQVLKSHARSSVPQVTHAQCWILPRVVKTNLTSTQQQANQNYNWIHPRSGGMSRQSKRTQSETTTLNNYLRHIS